VSAARVHILARRLLDALQMFFWLDFFFVQLGLDRKLIDILLFPCNQQLTLVFAFQGQFLLLQCVQLIQMLADDPFQAIVPDGFARAPVFREIRNFFCRMLR